MTKRSTCVRRARTAAAGLACIAASAGAAPAGGAGHVAPVLALVAAGAALLLVLVRRLVLRQARRRLACRLGRRRMRRALRDTGLEVLDDLILPGIYGGLVRIDHAVMTRRGILCLQCKHHEGRVSGTVDAPQWQNLHGAQQTCFLNPAIQNEGRTRSLRQVVPSVPVENLVVFTGRVQFCGRPAANVIHLSELEDCIERFTTAGAPLENPDAVWSDVKAAALTDDASRRDFEAQVSFG